VGILRLTRCQRIWLFIFSPLRNTPVCRLVENRMIFLDRVGAGGKGGGGQKNTESGLEWRKWWETVNRAEWGSAERGRWVKAVSLFV
jgi:hypothetical protein